MEALLCQPVLQDVEPLLNHHSCAGAHASGSDAAGMRSCFHALAVSSMPAGYACLAVRSEPA